MDLKIHACSELPPSSLDDDLDCLDRIRETFSVTRWLGSGSYGTVLLLKGASREDLVVKISDVAEDVELRIACQLNALAPVTPVFPHTYGWLACTEVPDEWLAILTDTERERVATMERDDAYLFTFVQPIQEKWLDIPFVVEHRYRTCLFLLLHGLWAARSQFGFHHGDLHAQNIMLQRADALRGGSVVVRYGDTEAHIATAYTPRLIDYGFSSTTECPFGGNYAEYAGYTNNDLVALSKLFALRFRANLHENRNLRDEYEAFAGLMLSAEWKRALVHYNDSGSEGADALFAVLAHDYFNVPEIRQEKATKRTRLGTCFSCCSSNVKFQVEHATPKYFCNPSCYQKIHAISQFIK